MQQIAEGLYTLTGLMFGRVYMIVDTDGLTLIDTSIEGAAKRIVKEITESGYKPDDVKRIIITHAHADHIGGLAELQAITGAQVMVSTIDRPVVEGKTPIVRRPQLPRPPQMTAKGTPVDRELNEGDTIDVLGGLQVLMTPGHSPGHITLWQPQKRIAIIADVLFNTPRLMLPPGIFTYDTEENKRSVRKVAALQPQIVCFGHGHPLTENAAARLQTFVASMK